MVQTHLTTWNSVASNYLAVATSKLHVLEFNNDDNVVLTVDAPNISSIDWQPRLEPFIAYGTSTGSVSVFDVANKQETIYASKRTVNAVAWNALDSGKLALGFEAIKGSDSSIAIWDVHHQRLQRVSGAHETCSTLCHYYHGGSGSSEVLISGTAMGGLKILDLRVPSTSSASSTIQAHPASRPRRIRGLRTSPLLPHMLISFSDAAMDTVKLWDLRCLSSGSGNNPQQKALCCTVSPYSPSGGASSSSMSSNNVGSIADAVFSSRSAYTIAVASTCTPAVLLFDTSLSVNSSNNNPNASNTNVVSTGAPAAPAVTITEFTRSDASMTIAVHDTPRSLSWQHDTALCTRYRGLLHQLTGAQEGMRELDAFAVVDQSAQASSDGSSHHLFEEVRCEVRSVVTEQSLPPSKSSSSAPTSSSKQAFIGLLAVVGANGVQLCPTHAPAPAPFAALPSSSTSLGNAESDSSLNNSGNDRIYGSSSHRYRDQDTQADSISNRYNYNLPPYLALVHQHSQFAPLSFAHTSSNTAVPSSNIPSSRLLSDVPRKRSLGHYLGGGAEGVSEEVLRDRAEAGYGHNIAVNLDLLAEEAKMLRVAMHKLTTSSAVNSSLSGTGNNSMNSASNSSSNSAATNQMSEEAREEETQMCRRALSYVQELAMVWSWLQQLTSSLPSTAAPGGGLMGPNVTTTLLARGAQGLILGQLSSGTSMNNSSNHGSSSHGNSNHGGSNHGNSNHGGSSHGTGRYTSPPKNPLNSSTAASMTQSTFCASLGLWQQRSTSRSQVLSQLCHWPTTATATSVSTSSTSGSNSAASFISFYEDCQQALRWIFLGDLDRALSLFLALPASHSSHTAATSTGLTSVSFHNNPPPLQHHQPLQQLHSEFAQLVALMASCLAGYQPSSSQHKDDNSHRRTAAGKQGKAHAASHLQQQARGSWAVMCRQLLHRATNFRHNLLTHAAFHSAPSTASATTTTAVSPPQQHLLFGATASALCAVLRFLLLAEEVGCAQEKKAGASGDAVVGGGCGSSPEETANSEQHSRAVLHYLAMEEQEAVDNRQHPQTHSQPHQPVSVNEGATSLCLLDRLAVAALYLDDASFREWVSRQLPSPRSKDRKQHVQHLSPDVPAMLSPVSSAAPTTAAASTSVATLTSSLARQQLLLESSPARPHHHHHPAAILSPDALDDNNAMHEEVEGRKVSLEALCLVGLETPQAQQLMQHHVDTVGDLQTVALLALAGVFAARTTASTSSPTDVVLAQWIVTYRNLLIQWQLTEPRVLLDTALNSQSKSFPLVFFTNYQTYSNASKMRGSAFADACTVFKTTDALPRELKKQLTPSALRVRCTFCGSALPPLHQLMDLWKQKPHVVGKLKNEKKLLRFCVKCAMRQHLPRCYVCQLFVGLLNPYRLVEALTEQGKLQTDSAQSTQRQQMQMLQQQQQQLSASSTPRPGNSPFFGSTGTALADGSTRAASMRLAGNVVTASTLTPRGSVEDLASMVSTGSSAINSAQQVREKERALQLENGGYRDLSLPFDDWLLMCQRCRHGGHSACLRRWFRRGPGQQEVAEEADEEAEEEESEVEEGDIFMNGGGGVYCVEVDPSLRSRKKQNKGVRGETLLRRVCGVNGCDCRCDLSLD